MSGLTLTGLSMQTNDNTPVVFQLKSFARTLLDDAISCPQYIEVIGTIEVWVPGSDGLSLSGSATVAANLTLGGTLTINNSDLQRIYQ